MAGTATVSAEQREHARTGEIHSVPKGLYDLHRPEAVADPWPVYRRFRAEGPCWDPVARVWLFSRHRDVARVLGDRELSVAMDHGRSRVFAPPAMGPLFDLLDAHVSLCDPPDHARLRRLLIGPFRPQQMEALDAVIGDAVAAVLNRRDPVGRMEVVADLATVIPLRVLRHLLGFDDLDLVTLRRWAAAWAHVFSAPGHVPTERTAQLLADIGELIDYLHAIIAAHRARPRDTVTRALVVAADDGLISETELVGNLLLLLAAGHATSAGLISSAAAAVADAPDLADVLRARPDLLPAAVEEFARVGTPVQYTTRIARSGVDIAGCRIEAGHTVVLLLAAACRDPEAFPEPDTVRLDRPAMPRHVAFGHGPHVCFGAGLARLETVHVLRGLLTLPDLRPDGDRRWQVHGNLRHLARLPLTFHPSHPTATPMSWSVAR